MHKLFLIISLFFAFQVANAQQQYHIAFYNVENLFDLKDDPMTLDDEFTPEGSKKWTRNRYSKKFEHLSRVLSGIGNIQFMGLSEVENKKVVEDLIKLPPFIEQEFKVVHYDSPDKRGIDVAFVYNSGLFKVINTDTIKVEFPDDIEKDYTTRLILHVEGELNNGAVLHFFINHWPSRRGGAEKSQPKRLWVAAHLKRAVSEILDKDMNANIIIMGDFNDEPNNLSISSVLGALPAHQVPAIPGLLYDLFDEYDQQEKGSYRYKANWNMLDQIVVSGSLLDTRKSSVTIEQPRIFQKSWMMYKNSKHGETPSRTYGGNRYFGGYSDHLPVFATMRTK